MTWRALDRTWHYVEKWAEEKPNKIAFISVNTGQEITWKEFNHAATAIAYQLIEMGIGSRNLLDQFRLYHGTSLNCGILLKLLA